MRTAFFVDGYNVFYGLLAGTPYKWLNLNGLLAHVAHIENPQSSVISIDYFTSSVKPNSPLAAGFQRKLKTPMCEP